MGPELLAGDRVPVFILCGGLVNRLREETEVRPNPMVPVGRRPILWHIIRTYAQHGFKEFVLCLGYKGEVIKSYFLNSMSAVCATTSRGRDTATSRPM